jgi:hypothetical protein
MFLLRGAPASRVSTHAYVNPLIAVALGAVAVKEPINVSIVMASLVIASGVALVLGARRTGHDGVHKDRRHSEAAGRAFTKRHFAPALEESTRHHVRGAPRTGDDRDHAESVTARR